MTVYRITLLHGLQPPVVFSTLTLGFVRAPSRDLAIAKFLELPEFKGYPVHRIIAEPKSLVPASIWQIEVQEHTTY